MKSKTKLIKENSIPPCRAGPIVRVYMKNFHLALVGSRQNHVRSHLGCLAHFSYEHTFSFYTKEFFKEGEISPMRASPSNRASSPSYEQPLTK